MRIYNAKPIFKTIPPNEDLYKEVTFAALSSITAKGGFLELESHLGSKERSQLFGYEVKTNDTEES